jgi:hypothetical protein
VKQFLAGGKVTTYDVCTYGYGKVPVGANLQVTAYVTSPGAFSTPAVPQTAIISPVNIINGQCNMLPHIVNPTAADLSSHWGSCQDMTYDVNFGLTQAPHLLNGTGGSQAASGGTQAGKVPGNPGAPLLNGGQQTLLTGTGSASSTKTGTAGSRQTYTGTTRPATPGSKVELNPQPFPPKQALTNSDVVAMLKGRLTESVIISALQSSPHKFDFSPTSCHELQHAHITANILNAMGDGSVRPCAEITGTGGVNGSGVTGSATPNGDGGLNAGTRQGITDITNRGAANSTAVSGTPNPTSPSSQAPNAAKPTRTVLKPVKLPVPSSFGKTTNPRLAQQNGAIIAVLEQQRQATQQESAAITGNLRSSAAAASARTTAVSANLQGNLSAQGLVPQQTQSAQGNLNSKIALAPAFNATVLTCTNDPTPRVLHVSGGQGPSVFTPEAKYNQYTIVGCSFGQSQGTARIFGVNGFSANLNIDFWSENGITAHLDPWLAGVLDQNNVTLIVVPVGQPQIQKQGFRFYAARGMPSPDGSDQEVQVAYDSMPQPRVQLYGAPPVAAGWNQVPSNGTAQFPSFSFQGTSVASWIFRYAYGHRDDSYPVKVPCYVNDIASNPDQGCGGYFGAIGFAPGATDTWDFSKLVAGFSVSSYELFYENTDASSLCGAWDDGGKNSGLAGSWNSNLTSQNQIVVSWPVYWCTDWEAMPFANRTNKQVQSSYGVAVWVLGPRCTDPWTGQKDQACMNKVKQILG